MASNPSDADQSTEVALADAADIEGLAGEHSWLRVLQAHGTRGDTGASEDHAGQADESAGPARRLLEAEGVSLAGDDDEASTHLDWSRVDYDPATYLPRETTDAPASGSSDAGLPGTVTEAIQDWIDRTPVTKDVYGWEHFKWEYYYGSDGRRPRNDAGDPEPFDPGEYLSFDPESITDVLETGCANATALRDVVEDRTVNVNPEIDEDAFFSSADGETTVTNRYDLEKAVPTAKKRHFEEVERYWVDKPYAFVVIFHSVTENEEKYYLIDPYLNDIEDELRGYIAGKLRTAIRYSDDSYIVDGTSEERKEVIEHEARRLLARYDLIDGQDGSDDLLSTVGAMVGLETPVREGTSSTAGSGLAGTSARPESAILEEDPGTLTEYQVGKILYRLKRDFIGYDRIDGIKRDINVEDISCDGYNFPVFVYHTEYEQLITNISHGEAQLDNFVIKLAQRSGKGISKREPQVDATLPDGSRAQLTLGREVSDHGTNYTIRQFNDVPFTPVDLINWNTFSLDEMAFLWLCIESEKSVMFGGGTASGKTTSLNAVSLFIPSTSKIVSIEDTREVELPQRNWVASITRPSFTDDSHGDVDEFDLLEAALRQRPEYIIMGEVRGEEGRTLFQVMSTGHTTLTTFHADSVEEVIKRFTTDPINVSKTMFTALDIVSIQTQTRVGGQKVRRNRGLTDVNYYDTDDDEINVQDVFEWHPETDEFVQMTRSNKLEEIQFDRGWDRDRLEVELFKRKVVLAYLIENGLNEYSDVAATIQAFINDPDTILALIARDRLEASLADLRGMESVMIDVKPEKEALVPRPEPGQNARVAVSDVLSRAERELFPTYKTMSPSPLVSALPDASDVGVDTAVARPNGGPDSSAAPTSEAADAASGSDEVEPPAAESALTPTGNGDDPESTIQDRDGDWLSERLQSLDAGHGNGSGSNQRGADGGEDETRADGESTNGEATDGTDDRTDPDADPQRASEEAE